MVKTGISFLAIHQDWGSDLMMISEDPAKAQSQIQKDLIRYKGVPDSLAGSFDNKQVYQISEREFFSFGDGVRYMLADNGKRIALIYMKGILLAGYSNSHYEMMAEIIKSAENSVYAGVLIIADSPGGTTRKMDKLFNAVSNYSKPIGVWVSGNLNSSASYVTAPADFILSDPKENNSFGAIGVFTIIENLSKKLKAEGHEVRVIRSKGSYMKFKPNPYEAWNAEELAIIQAKINDEGKKIINAISLERKLTPDIISKIQTGEDFDTQKAFKYNLHDGQATFEEALNKVANRKLFI
jgi:ClpP class serine protease